MVAEEPDDESGAQPKKERPVYEPRPQRTPEPFHELSRFVTTYRAIWEPRLDRLGAELERRQRNKHDKEKRK